MANANVDALISAIAQQEAGLAGLTQIEIRKLSALLTAVGSNINALNNINTQIARFLRLLIKKEIVLELLLDEASELDHTCNTRDTDECNE